MPMLKCPNCPQTVNTIANEAFHACPKTFDKRTRRFGKVITFDALPPFPEPEYTEGVVMVLDNECWVDEAGYAYSSKASDRSQVNVHNNWAEMLAAL